MAGTAYIGIKNSFADDTSRALKFGPFEETDDAIVNAKENIKTFNEETAATISDTYISDSGAAFTGITGAYTVVTEETEINLNV